MKKIHELMKDGMDFCEQYGVSHCTGDYVAIAVSDECLYDWEAIVTELVEGRRSGSSISCCMVGCMYLGDSGVMTDVDKRLFDRAILEEVRMKLLATKADLPCDPPSASLHTLIIHLNDECMWSKEEIYTLFKHADI